MQLDPLVAHLEGHFSFHHVEPFFLIQVEMQRRSTRKEMGVLHNEEAAGGFTGRHLEENRAEP
jgi:hypothetical protein